MTDRAVRKERGDRFTLVLQYEPTLIGNADEDSFHIECGRKKID